jgi:hypothetical protein
MKLFIFLLLLMLTSCVTWDEPNANHAGNIDYYLQKNERPVALERDSYGRTRSEVISCLFRYSSRFDVADTLYICD